MIAMALSSPDPGLLIADEPTTALDVTIQAQILTLIKELQERIHMSVLLITHDMGVVAETADFVSVMYAGRKVESGDVSSIFNNPKHPYTVGLMNSMPSNEKYTGADRLEAINGSVPELHTLGEGCPFANRCSLATDECRQSFPEINRMHENHHVFCYHSDKV